MEQIRTPFPFPFHDHVEGGSFNRAFVEQLRRISGLVGAHADNVRQAAKIALELSPHAEAWRVSSENFACSPLVSANNLPHEKVVRVASAQWALAPGSSRALDRILNGYRLPRAGGDSETPDMNKQGNYMRGLQPQYINFHLPKELPWFEVGVNRGDFYAPDEIDGTGARTGGLTALARVNHIEATAGAIFVEVNDFMTCMGYLEGLARNMTFIRGRSGWTVEQPNLR